MWRLVQEDNTDLDRPIMCLAHPFSLYMTVVCVGEHVSMGGGVLLHSQLLTTVLQSIFSFHFKTKLPLA